MSDRVVQSSHDEDGKAAISMHPSQSAWMAHWRQPSYRSAPQACDYLSLQCRPNEADHHVKKCALPSEQETASDMSKSSKGFREVTEYGPFKIINKSVKSSNNLRKESIKLQSFPMFNLVQDKDSILGPTDERLSICSKQVLKSSVDHDSGYKTITFGTNESSLPLLVAEDPSKPEATFGGCHFLPQGTSENLHQLVKSHNFLGKKKFTPRSLQSNFLGETSNVTPHGFSTEKTPIQSFMCRQEKINHLNSILVSEEHFRTTCVTHLEHEHCSCQSYSAFLVCKEKMESSLNCGTSGTLLSEKNYTGMFLRDPSTSNYKVPDLFGEPCQKLQSHSDIRFFPCQSSLPEMNKSKPLYHGCYSPQKMPFCVHDAKTMRIAAIVDSVEGMGGGPSNYSQTMHRMLITEKTDAKLSEGRQMFKESIMSKKLKGKTFTEPSSLSSAFGRPGWKLHSLDNSTDSEETEKTGEGKPFAFESKPESSAETDTMDMNAFQENYRLPDLALSQSNKDITGGENLSSVQANLASNTEEVGRRQPNNELPDMNEEPPAHLAGACSTGDGEPSISRTQSLEADHFLSYSGHPASCKLSPSPVGPWELEPCSRWVKRLRMTKDSSAHGTKSSKMGEAGSHEKVNKLFNKILKGSIASSEATSGTNGGSEQLALNKTAMLLKNGDSSSMNSVKAGKEITLSHSWIQRWCRNQVASLRKKPKAGVVCEPQSSKAAFEHFQKEQFPSIAAMALMGKAMNGFRPCEIRKRGSSVVWNTNGL